MRSKTAILALLLAAAVLYAGCSDGFLDVQPTESTALDAYFTSEENVVAAVNAAYASLQNTQMYAELYPKALSGASDDFDMDNTSDLELQTFSWDATLRPTDQAWQGLYEGVFRSNMVLQEAPDVEMDEARRERILGEARFLRALSYWHLAALFGDVPLVTSADPTDASEAELPKSPVTDIIDLAISDLQMAAERLPSSYNAENVGRATAGAAKALLGKVHLYSASPLFGGNEEGYALAAEQFRDVIENHDYELVDYQNLWVEDNNAETVFEVQYTDVGGSIWGAQDAASINETQLRGALNYPNGHGGNGNLLPTQELVDEFEAYDGPDEEGVFGGRDPRLYYSVWREGDDYDDVEPTYQSGWSPTGYSLKKGLAFPFTDRAEDGTTRNVPVIRYGDVLLMYAEAANAKSSREAQEAIDAINQVRERVDMPPYPDADAPFSVDAGSSEQEIFEAIVHERRVELSGEYQRYHDLRRWGLGAEQMGDLGFQTPRHNFFPIPAAELDNNPNLEQNPDY